MSIYILNTRYIDKGLLYSLCEQTRTQIISPDFKHPQIDNKKLDQIEKYVNKQGIKWFTNQDSTYHFKFLQVPSKPGIVYYIGNINLLSKKVLGVVGPRIATNYGKKVVIDLLEKSKSYDMATISGLAEGIDTLCHEQSLQNGIPTIAVLGGGFQYYLHNRQFLIEKIIGSGGLIVSEFKIGFKPTKYSFPQRNRIIAGLSDVLFLPEASEKSGSLITVDFALKAGKKVFAVPNDIYNPHSSGINHYIADHKIQAIYNIQNFLENNFIKKNKKTFMKEKIQAIDLDPDEQLILKYIQGKELSINELMIGSEFDISRLLIALNLLEIKGIIVQTNTGIFKTI